VCVCVCLCLSVCVCVCVCVCLLALLLPSKIWFKAHFLITVLARGNYNLRLRAVSLLFLWPTEMQQFAVAFWDEHPPPLPPPLSLSLSPSLLLCSCPSIFHRCWFRNVWVFLGPFADFPTTVKCWGEISFHVKL